MGMTLTGSLYTYTCTYTMYCTCIYVHVLVTCSQVFLLLLSHTSKGWYGCLDLWCNVFSPALLMSYSQSAPPTHIRSPFTATAHCERPNLKVASHLHNMEMVRDGMVNFPPALPLFPPPSQPYPSPTFPLFLLPSLLLSSFLLLLLLLLSTTLPSSFLFSTFPVLCTKMIALHSLFPQPSTRDQTQTDPTVRRPTNTQLGCGTNQLDDMVRFELIARDPGSEPPPPSTTAQQPHPNTLPFRTSTAQPRHVNLTPSPGPSAATPHAGVPPGRRSPVTSTSHMQSQPRPVYTPHSQHPGTMTPSGGYYPPMGGYPQRPPPPSAHRYMQDPAHAAYLYQQGPSVRPNPQAMPPRDGGMQPHGPGERSTLPPGHPADPSTSPPHHHPHHHPPRRN